MFEVGPRTIMRNIKLAIQYDGTNYCGWQSQKNGVAIQDVIEKALKKVVGEKIKLVGSGRTDSGVHAKGQIANFKTNSEMPLASIKKGLNSNLSDDIIVAGAEETNPDFHAQYSSRSKLYRYALTNKNPISPFHRNYIAFTPYKLDLELMKKEARALLGKHDFSAFQGARSKRIGTTRTVKKLLITKYSRYIYIDIESDGFLYNMARNIAGTLIEIGRGRFQPGSMKRILKSRDRRKAGPTAPAKGLCLMKVMY